MEASERTLYERICRFELDERTAVATFTRRLAQENRWTAEYTRRVLREYRRFVFLAIAQPHRVVPSDHVDRAWHLHLVHTESYWNTFCPNVLERPLHHTPSAGGPGERQQLVADYARTLESYAAAFGEEPPSDIWPASDRRFGTDLHSARVNTVEHWIVPKPWQVGLRRTFPGVLGALAVAAPFAFFVVSLDIPAPGTWSPAQFVIVPAVLSLLAFGSAWLLTRKPATSREVPLHAVEVAALAGGQSRAFEVALVSAIRHGSVELDPSENVLSVCGPLAEGAHTLERALYAHVVQKPSTTVKACYAALGGYTGELQRELQERGLLSESGRELAWFIASFAPAVGMVAIFLDGPPRDAGAPLLVSCLVVLVLAQRAFAGPASPTALGKRALRQLRASNAGAPDSAAQCPSSSLLPTTVALLGVQVLMGTDLEELGSALGDDTSGDSASGNDASDAGDAGGDAGGDADGGGCGGCGGCGGGCG
jgi:uncharacterized protein (TIGR04222 family)